jgi:hypothetical protein
MFCVSGVAPQSGLYVNNPDINTLESALLARMFYHEVNGEMVTPISPENQIFRRELNYFRSFVARFKSTPVSLNEVVEMYKGPKRTVYSNALESLNQRPLQRKDAVSKAFVKCEKVKKDKAPRCIQPRDARYNLVLGSYIKIVEKRIYKNIDKIYKSPTVMKGYNVYEIGSIIHSKWTKYMAPCAIGLDATKFDMHVSAQALGWEHSIYLKIFGNDPKLKQLLEWQMYNRGVGYCKDGKLKYTVTGKRFSGDMNTGLGNVIIMTAIVHCYMKTKNYTFDLVNNGDDCVVIMEKKYENDFRASLAGFFSRFGFMLTTEPTVYNIEQIEFCQMHPICTVNGWVMVRNIPTALIKDTQSVLPLNTAKAFKVWLANVGDCGMTLCAGVPILQAFYNMYRRLGTKLGKMRNSKGFQTGIHLLMHGIDKQSLEFEITQESRVAVWLAWGISPDVQIELEQFYANTIIDYTLDTAALHTEHDHILF